eukprot:6041035-Heterocapsa_arctica.AAC.1
MPSVISSSAPFLQPVAVRVEGAVVEDVDKEVRVVLREVGEDVVVPCVDDVVLGEVVVREESEVDRNVEGVVRGC